MPVHPDTLSDDVEDIPVSKSALKRDAAELKKLGEQLVTLGKTQLAKLPLDEELHAAITLASQLKREGLRRQLQLIGKLLRQRDTEPLRQALDKLQNRHNQQVLLFHKLEALRDTLLTQGDSAIDQVIAQWPQADRQHLRGLIRNGQKELANQKPPKSARLIYQYLRELAEYQP